MKKALVPSIGLLALAGPVAAETRYDRKLEEAVLSIVASRIGEIRGGFDLGVKPIMVAPRNDAATRAIAPRAAADVPEGMSRAVERAGGPTRTF